MIHKIQHSLIMLYSLLVFSVGCQQSSDSNEPRDKASIFDEAAETEAIMKSIEGETKCFFDGNYECWANYWSHEKYAVQAWNNNDGSADAAVGWDKIDAQGKAWIEKYYQNGKIMLHPVVVREKPTVKFFNEKTAYLTWSQYNADTEKTNFRTSQEIRLMEKDDEGWKIITVAAFWDTQAKIPFDSLNVN